jgi:hypothetical protein
MEERIVSNLTWNREANVTPSYLCCMPLVRLFCLLLSVTCFAFLVIGLFKPWILLWWEDVQNRKKIIKVYGSLAVLFFAAYKMLEIFI